MQGLIICNVYPDIKINGALIDAFEYYITILEHNPEFKLIMPGFTELFLNYLKNIFKERYYLDNLNWEDNICSIPMRSTIHMKFDKVLVVDYGSIRMLKGTLVSKKIIVLSDLYTTQKEFDFKRNLYDIEYYGEMPFVYKDHQYRMKMAFDRYKNLKDAERCFYVSSPGGGLTLDVRLEIASRIGARGFRNTVYFKRPEHRENFFELFKTYVYYHRNKYFDPRPRLPIEALFYGKKLMYFNDYDIKDGSYYRFKDIEENGISNRTLNKDDEVVRLFI